VAYYEQRMESYNSSTNDDQEDDNVVALSPLMRMVYIAISVDGKSTTKLLMVGRYIEG
jgi:hypothetical protein